MEIDLSNYPKPERHLRKQKECIIDLVNNCLRPATPEEDVRQRVLEFLHDVMEVPYEAMETEVNLSHYKKGLRGRIDIVIDALYEDKRSTIMIIECKAEDVELTDTVFQQADNYAVKTNTPLIMITNGIEAQICLWNSDKEDYEILDYYPTYNDLLNYNNLDTKEIEEYHYERYPYDVFLDKIKLDNAREKSCIFDSNTDEELIAPILNINDAFLDTSHQLTDLKLNNHRFIEDLGIRYTEFSNASGEGYIGDYRYIAIKDQNKDIQLISFAIFDSLDSRTNLMVAIDDINKHHNSLELNLNTCSDVNDNSITIFHDGRMTVGKQGAVKRQKVLDYVLENSNLELYDDKNIYLGKLDTSKLMYIDDDDFKELLSNLIEYALVRDNLRDIIKEEKK